MARQRFAFAWIACLAVLFNALAMSMAGATKPTESLLRGSFCSSSGTQLLAISLGTLDLPTPQKDDHSTLQHGWCCSGSAPWVALPGHVPQLYVNRYDAAHNLPAPARQSPTPRQQWPSLSPRASPVA